jgi:hypothetical protein
VKGIKHPNEKIQQIKVTPIAQNKLLTNPSVPSTKSTTSKKITFTEKMNKLDVNKEVTKTTTTKPISKLKK